MIIFIFDENIRFFATFILIPLTIINGGLALRSLQTLEVTAEKVIVSSKLKTDELYWHQIERVKGEHEYKRFIFYGADKRLAAPGFEAWGKDSETLLKMIRAYTWQHQIEIEDQNPRRPFFILNSPPTRNA